MAENTNTEARTRLTTDRQVALIKGAFKGNEYLLKAVRNLFFGVPVSDEDKSMIQKVFSNKELKLVFRKKCYPIFEEDMADLPVNSVADFWGGVEANIFGCSRDTIYQNINSKIKVRNYLDMAMALLDNPQGEQIDLRFTPSMSDDLQINLLARNLYIRTILETMNFIQIVCAQEEIKPQEKKKKQALDSSE